MTVEKGKSEIANNNKNVNNTTIHVVGAVITKNKTILETPRLILREMEQTDYPALAAIMQDEKTMYAYGSAFSDAETQEWLDRNLRRYEEDGFGLWAVILKSSGDMIGQCGITWQEAEDAHVPEIGYSFNRAYWHEGYATEAAIACKEYAFNTLGFKEIFSIVRCTNIASKDVAIRNGMIIRGRFIKNFRGEDMPHFVLSAKNPPELLKMDDFFAALAPFYDEYMLNSVEGFPESCARLVKHIPGKTETLLDLGCGTGLELEELFKLFPDIRVTGIDITQAMLDRLAEKYKGKKITLICASYLDYDFGHEKYDCAVSLETMHHWTHEEKLMLYKNILSALKPGGRYIEGDYMVETQAEEENLFTERKRLREIQNIPDGDFYHFDIPCTVENQIKLFLQAGFSSADKVWHSGKTAIITGQK